MFPTELFTFPLNMICCVIWIAAVVSLYRNCRSTSFVRFMLSPAAPYFSIGLLISICIFIGLTDRRDLTDSWIFTAILFFFQTVLLFVVLRGWKKSPANIVHHKHIRWRFIMMHAGLIIALGSGFWGAPDKQIVRMKPETDKPTNETWYIDGRPSWLPYSITLKAFNILKFSDGSPESFEAKVIIDDKPVSLRVNHPYKKNLVEDIYLSSYDSAAGDDSNYCIIQIVRDPWKYGKVIGIIMLLAGVFLLFINGPEVYRHDD